jgi:hypothetical protein
VRQLSPFRIMNIVFAGFGISLLFGALVATVVAVSGSVADVQQFIVAYTTSFKTLTSLGLAIGTALFVASSQSIIPETIEKSFTLEELAQTEYFTYRRRFSSAQRSITFAAEFVVAGFVVFTLCHFPLQGPAEVGMMVAACTEYALGVYVGRKLCYGGMMLHSLLKAKTERNLFRARELDAIDTLVHIASTLTIVVVLLHVSGYYDGPFLYDSPLGPGVRPLLLLPAIIATPVLLIFNFYPRAVLRRLYGQSIDVEMEQLRRTIQTESLSSFEKKAYTIAVDKMARDELQNSLRLTLSDLPIGITIIVMIAKALLAK